MKSKFFILKIFIYFFFIIFSNKILSDEFIFNASEIQSLDKGNKIKGEIDSEVRLSDILFLNNRLDLLKLHSYD